MNKSNYNITFKILIMFTILYFLLNIVPRNTMNKIDIYYILCISLIVYYLLLLVS